MAAPHVARAAALMLAVDGNLTVAELAAGILGNVDPLPALQGLTVTGALGQACAAPPRFVGGETRRHHCAFWKCACHRRR